MGLLHKKKKANEPSRHAKEIAIMQRRLDRLEPRVSALELEVKLYRREK